MSGILTFKCPSCGAYLEFDPASQSFTCPYCESSFTEAQAHDMAEGKAMEAAFDAQMRSYHCQACGAEIVTDETTAATRCYYCHNPVVLSDRLQGEFHPDGVIPFTLSREQALQKFNEYIAKHRFVDKRFFEPGQMENFTGVYEPYWLSDVAGDAWFDGEGTRVSTTNTPRERIVVTRYFAVHREGRLVFRDIVRKALSKVDRQLSDGIHPYDLKAVKRFDMSYMSGFLAEKRDIEADSIRGDIMQEVNGYVPGMIGKKETYSSLRGNSNFTPTATSMRYLLLPVWVLTYKAADPGKTYYFMMNGQNGKVCGRLPVRRGLLAGIAAACGAAVAVLLMLGGMFIW